MGYLDFLDLILEEELAVREERRLHHALRASKMPHHKTLDDYDFAYQPELDPRKVRDLASLAFVEGKANAALLGPPGVGKTHLAVAVLKQVMESSGARGLFYDTRDLLRVIRSTYDPSIQTTELEILRPVMTADLLVLDDLGAEKTSEWVEETMNLIVNTRYNERRLTIFTSNYLDIPDDSDPNSLLFRIGFRMRSRLHEMCEFIEMDGADYRELPVNGGVDDLITLWKMRKKSLPARAGRQARAQLREPAVHDGRADLKWPGGRAGS
jgi:DNA replication protein DnaC